MISYITSIKATHVNREIFGVALIVEWSGIENMSARYFILIKYLREYSHISFVHIGPFPSRVWRERLGLLHNMKFEKVFRIDDVARDDVARDDMAFERILILI